MNEEEMKTKWCPFVRQVAVDKNNHVLNDAAFNKCVSEEGRVFEPKGSNCIGSQCAAWVWTTDCSQSLNQFKFEAHPSEKDSLVCTQAPERTGCCGLIKG